MSRTIIGLNDPKAVKKWAGKLAVDTVKQSYWERKFTTMDGNAPILKRTELESDQGDKISYDLSVQLRQPGVRGDDRAEGSQENLRFFTDDIGIDQLRKPISAGGKMTRKRILHDLRQVAEARGKDWWSALFDEYHFMYLSGARGHDAGFIEPLGFTGHGPNGFTAPDAAHHMYGGDAASVATLTAEDKMTRALIERAAVQAETIKTLDAESANMTPIMIDGEKHYVIVMSPFQAHDLRQESNANGWMDIQKELLGFSGLKNPICSGGLGMLNNVILHKHDRVISFNDGGVGGNVPYARALLLGAQAGVVAYGSANGQTRMEWNEESLDFGNEAVIVTGSVFGMKKCQFNGRDFGVIALDTAAANPNK